MKLVVGTPTPGLLEYQFWHLLVDGSAHYLYVNCEQSAASFPIMVQLTPEEYVEYHALGWTFLQYMAEKISYWPSTYSTRRVSNELQAAAEAVINTAKPQIRAMGLPKRASSNLPREHPPATKRISLTKDGGWKDGDRGGWLNRNRLTERKNTRECLDIKRPSHGRI